MQAAKEPRSSFDAGRSRAAPAERLLELQPSNGRGHPARVGIRDELRPVDVRPFPRSRTARREHDEEQNEDTHLHETLLLAHSSGLRSATITSTSRSPSK